MSEKALPIEISIWDVPSVKYDGEIYGDYIITDVDSDNYIDVVEEIHWDALYIRGVSNLLDIEGLGLLTFLKRLEIFSGTINEIVGLEKLLNLEVLNLSFNQIKSTSGLQTLVNLKELHLSDNCISEVRGLRELRSLKKLFLYNNQIHKLDGYELPLSLEVLSLKGNDEIKIINLDGHRNLKKFTK